jgi:hypothetical protein
VNLASPLLIPPKLLLRALDDLHTIATVAEDANARLARLEASADALVVIGAQMEEHARSVLELGGKIDERGKQIVAEGKIIQDRAREVSDRAGQVLEALPLLERAIALAQPLEGAVERLGRVADRLPGGRAAGRARRADGPPRP